MGNTVYTSIQGCRAIAALLVVFFHLGAALSSPKYFGATGFERPFVFGDSGVAFFFVLSGFIITWAHFHDIGVAHNFSRYVRKRITRIYPSYWIVFFVLFVSAQISSNLRSTLPHDWPTLIKSLALVPQDKHTVGGTGAPVVVVAWSLQYEVCFYALFAAFILRPSLGFLISAVLLINYGVCRVDVCRFPQSFFADNWILLFGFGALIAVLSKRSIRIPHPMALAISAACAFICYGAFEAICGTGVAPLDRRLVYGALSGILLMSLVQAENSGRFRADSRLVALLGDSSYALYLMHFALISLFCKLLVLAGLHGVSGAFVAFPIILATCVGTAISFHLFVEKPVLDLWSGKKTPGLGITAVR
jgi:peptidoglycan/LPS O-acetylase OafA/YrhL